MITAIRFLVAASVASAMTSVGCADRPATAKSSTPPAVAVNGDEIVHAFDTQMELRLIDRLERDNFLRDRRIRVEVVDGVVNLSGEVWTPLERERAADLLRTVPGVIDVANELAIRPPR